MIVVEHEGAFVRRVGLPADAPIARAEIAVARVRFTPCGLDRNGFAAPRPILPMRRHDDPLFTQRMPPLLPQPERAFRTGVHRPCRACQASACSKMVSSAG